MANWFTRLTLTSLLSRPCVSSPAFVVREAKVSQLILQFLISSLVSCLRVSKLWIVNWKIAYPEAFWATKLNDLYLCECCSVWLTWCLIGKLILNFTILFFLFILCSFRFTACCSISRFGVLPFWTGFLHRSQQLVLARTRL